MCLSVSVIVGIYNCKVASLCARVRMCIRVRMRARVCTRCCHQLYVELFIPALPLWKEGPEAGPGGSIKGALTRSTQIHLFTMNMAQLG